MLNQGDLEIGAAVPAARRGQAEAKSTERLNHKPGNCHSSIYLETVADAYPNQR